MATAREIQLKSVQSGNPYGYERFPFNPGQQKDMGMVIIGHTAEGDVKGVNCDYTEADFPLTLSNCHIVFKGGALADFSACTLILSGSCIVEFGYIATAHYLNTLNVNVFGITPSYIVFINCKVSNIANLSGINNTIGNINNPYLNISVSGTINISDIEVNTLTHTGTTIAIKNSYLNTLTTNAGTISIRNTEINTANVVNGLNLTNSYVNNLNYSGLTTNSLALINSDVNYLNTSVGVVKITSDNINNSLGIGDSGFVLSFTDRSQCNLIYRGLVETMPPSNWNLTFGDGTAANDFTDVYIKMIMICNTGIGGLGVILNMNDNPNGVGTTYRNNIFELVYGELAVFNLTGGATNLLKRTGALAGITDTANNYTVINTCY